MEQIQKIKKRNANKQNVVIIILESFASEFVGFENEYDAYTPFLDKLSKKGLAFTHHYSNGQRSITSLPAILAGIPHLMEEGSFSISIYQGNTVYGLGYYLRKSGYSTAFFHGGRNGSMGFDGIARISGFKEYYGMNEYPNAEEDFDGSWGVYDEPYLQYFAEKLSDLNEPFGAVAFTLTSHHPYEIPEKYKNKFLGKKDQPMLKTIQYTDHALEHFFEKAKTQKWYDKTLFVITGDHTHLGKRPEYHNTLGLFDVPLILYHPKEDIPKVKQPNQISQHADIMPTVLDYLGIERDKKYYFGRSLFSNEQGVAVYKIAGVFVLVHNDYYLVYTDAIGSRLFKYTPHSSKHEEVKDQPMITKKYETELKAYMQYYFNGLVENNLYWK